MFDLLKTALRGGIKSSEFYLAILALFVPLADGLIDKTVHYINGVQTTSHNPLMIAVLAGAAAFISGAYSIARAFVKREQIKQIPHAMAVEQLGPNTVTTNPTGTAEAERAHAIQAGADPLSLPLGALRSSDPNDR